MDSAPLRRIATALQCAATLVALLVPLGVIAWAAGLAAPADLSYVLTGVFAGSFAVGVLKQERPKARRI